MKYRIPLVGAIVLLALAASIWAADITGKWVAEIPGRQGNTTQTTFDLKADGAKLTGTVTTPRGENPISEGKIDGSNISFVVVIKFNENEMKQMYKGVVSGEEIKFTREMQMPAGGMGGPGGGAGGGGGMGGGAPKPMEFVAKRAK
jgi:hypothetical protein